MNSRSLAVSREIIHGITVEAPSGIGGTALGGGVIFMLLVESIALPFYPQSGTESSLLGGGMRPLLLDEGLSPLSRIIRRGVPTEQPTIASRCPDLQMSLSSMLCQSQDMALV
jgi:hypothetical protein